jgi:hypothetical protein
MVQGGTNDISGADRVFSSMAVFVESTQVQKKG